jgi:hypothetical protein
MGEDERGRSVVALSLLLILVRGFSLKTILRRTQDREGTEVPKKLTH